MAGYGRGACCCDRLAALLETVITTTVSVIDTVIVGDFTLPAGALSYSILVETGSANINGAIRPAGYSVNQPPLPYGKDIRLYPEISITAVTGTVHISYVTD